jgi:uncharacterized phage-associated protein
MEAMQNPYKKRKGAELTQFLLYSLGGECEIVKLTKLLYLIERTAITKHGFTITSDRLVSMDKGPLGSLIYDSLKEPEKDPYLSGTVTKDSDDSNLIKLIGKFETNSLSTREKQIVKNIAKKFRNMGKWEVVGYCHDNLKEWEDPSGSSKDVDKDKMLEETKEKKEVIEERLAVSNFLDSVSAK